jgi:hypothetical protein
MDSRRPNFLFSGRSRVLTDPLYVAPLVGHPHPTLCSTPRFSVPEPLDSHSAYVSRPIVLLTATNTWNPATLHRLLHVEILSQSFQRWSEEPSGLSRPGEVASACQMRWASKPMSAISSVFCIKEDIYQCFSAFCCCRSRLGAFVAKRVPLVNADCEGAPPRSWCRRLQRA